MMTTSTVHPPDRFPKSVNRREFLYYLGGASVALLAAELCSVFTKFALPHEQFGVDFFEYGIDQIPAVDSAPQLKNGFYLSHTEQGLFALSRVCSQHDCAIRFVDGVFICPCCGGHFDLDGTFLGNSFACRDLARFVVEVSNQVGVTAITSPEGGAVSLQSGTSVTVHIRQQILGKMRNQSSDCANHKPIN